MVLWPLGGMHNFLDYVFAESPHHGHPRQHDSGLVDVRASPVAKQTAVSDSDTRSYAAAAHDALASAGHSKLASAAHSTFAAAGNFLAKQKKPPYTNANNYSPGLDGTYAQNYQDTWFVALARRNGWLSRPGFYMDLGACHPYECSNSALLDVEYGWSGICVEPRRTDFSSRSCVTLHRAMSNTDGKVVSFFGEGQITHEGYRPQEGDRRDSEFKVETISVEGIIKCVNSTDSNTAACGEQGKKVHIPNFVEFVSLDIESHEDEVISTWPWDKITVGAFVIENRCERPECIHLREVLKRRGYVQAPVENEGVDDYFVLEKFWDASLAKKAWRHHPPGSNDC